MNQPANQPAKPQANQPVKQPGKPSGKPTTCIILARLYPATEKDVAEALQVYNEYCKSVTKDYTHVKFELICAIEGQLAWLETWKTRADLNAFYDNTIGLTDFPARFMQFSKRPPERLHMQPVGMAINNK